MSIDADTLDDRFQDIENKYKTYIQDVRLASDAFDQTAADIAARQQALATTETLTSRVAELGHEAKHWEASCRDEQRRADRHSGEISSLKEQLAEARASLAHKDEQVRQAAAKASQELDALKNDRLEQQLSDILARLPALDLNRNNQVLDKATAAIDVANQDTAKLAQLQASLSAKDKQISLLNTTIEGANQEVKTLATDKSILEQRLAAKGTSDSQALQQQVALLQDSLSTEINKHKKTAKDMEDLAERLSAMTRSRNDRDNQIKQLQSPQSSGSLSSSLQPSPLPQPTECKWQYIVNFLGSFKAIIQDDSLQLHHVLKNLAITAQRQESRERFAQYIAAGSKHWFCVEGVTKQGHLHPESRRIAVYCKFKESHKESCMQMRIISNKPGIIIEFSLLTINNEI